MILRSKTNIKDKSNQRKGFTLSEVLVTLVIIGVVAAMTIPSLMQSTEKKELLSAFRKAHSVLMQGMYLIADHNGYPHGDLDYFNEEYFLDEFRKHTSVLKICETMEECIGKPPEQLYKYLNNSAVSNEDLWSTGRTAITNDGIIFTFVNIPRGSAVTYGLTEDERKNTIGRIIIDSNGERDPNKVGADVFVFYVVDGKGILPAGSNSALNLCNRSSNGMTCAAKVIKLDNIIY